MIQTYNATQILSASPFSTMISQTQDEAVITIKAAYDEAVCGPINHMQLRNDVGTDVGDEGFINNGVNSFFDLDGFLTVTIAVAGVLAIAASAFLCVPSFGLTCTLVPVVIATMATFGIVAIAGVISEKIDETGAILEDRAEFVNQLQATCAACMMTPVQCTNFINQQTMQFDQLAQDLADQGLLGGISDVLKYAAWALLGLGGVIIAFNLFRRK